MCKKWVQRTEQSLAAGEILALLITKARKVYIVPQLKLRIVLKGKRSHFLSNYVFRGSEWCFSSSEQTQGKQKCWKWAFISRLQANPHWLAENALQRERSWAMCQQRKKLEAGNPGGRNILLWKFYFQNQPWNHWWRYIWGLNECCL